MKQMVALQVWADDVTGILEMPTSTPNYLCVEFIVKKLQAFLNLQDRSDAFSIAHYENFPLTAYNLRITELKVNRMTK